ncbi:MAG TPA: HAD family hydrolase [Dehalococcoidia bacterium]|nr:HAD family hydrolase [Dehalococcoidia bacterium]
MIRAIFYDAGHTLVRPRPEIDEVWDFLAHQLGITIAEEHRGPFPDVAAFFYSRLGEDGLGSYSSDARARTFWTEYYVYSLRDAARDVPRAEIESAGGALFDWYADPAQWQPFPEVIEALEGARARGLIQGVVSDWGSDLLPILHAHEITRLMDFVVASAVMGSSKPHRDIFLHALGRAGVRAEETVYVGDSYLADVLGSRGAGLHPVLIDRDRTAPRVDAPVIHALTELVEVVDAIDASLAIQATR